MARKKKDLSKETINSIINHINNNPKLKDVGAGVYALPDMGNFGARKYKDYLVYVDENHRVVDISKLSPGDNFLTHREKIEKNIEREQYIIKRQKLLDDQIALTREFKTDTTKWDKKFENVHTKYLESDAKVFEYINTKLKDKTEDMYAQELDEFDEEAFIRNLYTTDKKLKLLQNKKITSMDNFFKVGEVLSKISGKDYRQDAYNIMSGSTIGEDYGPYTPSAPPSVRSYKEDLVGVEEEKHQRTLDIKEELEGIKEEKHQRGVDVSQALLEDKDPYDIVTRPTSTPIERTPIKPIPLPNYSNKELIEILNLKNKKNK